MANQSAILWVDDEPAHIRDKVQFLEDCGYKVYLASTPKRSMEILTNEEVSLAIIDVMIKHDDEFEAVDTQGGHATGQVLARWIKQNTPNVKIVGCSVRTDTETVKWFIQYTSGYWPKHELRPNNALKERVENIIYGLGRSIRSFIVHGHAEQEKLELKNYIQNTLQMGEPIILHEQPSLGRTIIEKFEDESEDVDVVFVLLTPDDLVCSSEETNEEKRRARQNVIFEMGYFYGKLLRKNGRVILLYKGDLELPSDISGIIYINIKNGVESAGEEIRKELVGFI